MIDSIYYQLGFEWVEKSKFELINNLIRTYQAS